MQALHTVDQVDFYKRVLQTTRWTVYNVCNDFIIPILFRGEMQSKTLWCITASWNSSSFIASNDSNDDGTSDKMRDGKLDGTLDDNLDGILDSILME